MSYAIINCYQSSKKSERIALVIDALVILTAITICSLAFTKLGNLDHFKYPICAGASALVLAILLANILVAIRKSSKIDPVLHHKTLIIRQLRDEINSTISIQHEQEKLLSDFYTTCHNIFRDLYLGNFGSVFETLGYRNTYFSPAKDAKEILISPNKDRFQSIISLNEFDVSFDFCRGPHDYNEKGLREAGLGGTTTWHDLGVPDQDHNAWESLIRKCGKIPPYDPLPSVQDWFEPVFQEMDKAIFGGQKTLVHCHAGISRSTGFLIAYMIKRFDVTAEQALTYVKNKRSCVNPHLMPQLQNYYKALHPVKEE